MLLPARLEIQGMNPGKIVTLSLLEPETQVKLPLSTLSLKSFFHPQTFLLLLGTSPPLTLSSHRTFPPGGPSHKHTLTLTQNQSLNPTLTINLMKH